jgi:hypothetical protein
LSILLDGALTYATCCKYSFARISLHDDDPAQAKSNLFAWMVFGTREFFLFSFSLLDNCPASVMFEPSHLTDRVLGCVLGGAVGDALGAPFEGL